MEYNGIVEYAAAFGQEVADCVSKVSETEMQRFYSDIKSAKRIFAYAPGRCGNLLRCFIMRLMHLGLEVYVVGDTMTPNIGEGDLLITAAAAGYNEGIASIERRARGFGAKVVLFTIVSESLCAQNADYTVIIPGATAALGGIGHSIYPGGSLYEISMLCLLDGCMATLNREMGDVLSHGVKRHANLE